MDLPLSLDVLSLTPGPLLPGFPLGDGGDVPPAGLAADPPGLPEGVLLSPTSNYPGPYGTALLGERMSAHIRLRNVSDEPVRGAKMMLEVQSPAARARLGEAVHGDGTDDGRDPSSAEDRPWEDLPRLEPGDYVALDVSHDIAELGSHILICSVAWETPDGRRTFQRFLKFTAVAPLAIKTRVQLPTNPNTALSAQRRGDVYLEVLMQNVSPQSMMFGPITLLANAGLRARSLGSDNADDAAAAADASLPDGKDEPDVSVDEVDAGDISGPSLRPGDTMQRLFVLSPALGDSVPIDEPPGRLPYSVFPPAFATGTVVPLGRLDISWVSGAYREPGRFTTSMLNRRTLATTAPAGHAPPTSRPASVQGMPGSARSSLQAPSRPPEWEYDLTVVGERAAPSETVHELALRVGVRTPPVHLHTHAPTPLRVGIQFLAPAAVAPTHPPVVAVQPPSRTATPQARAASPAPSVRSSIIGPPSGTAGSDASRPFSPAIPSRPMTPVSAQLRHAAVSHIASPSPAATPTPPVLPPPPIYATFPPPPVLERPPVPLAKRLAGATLVSAPGTLQVPPVPVGRVTHIGPTLVVPPAQQWRLVRERPGTSYAAETPGAAAHNRWEAVYEVPLRILGTDAGLAEIGGVRVLLMDTESIGREWDTLGDVWVGA